MIPFSERNIDLVLVDDPCNLDDNKDDYDDNDDENRNASLFWAQMKMASVTLFSVQREYKAFFLLEVASERLPWNLTKLEVSAVEFCPAILFHGELLFILQKGSFMCGLGVRISSSLRKSSVFWVLNGSFVGCSLVIFAMHITGYIMWSISLRNFSILKIESLKMSSQANNSRSDTMKITKGPSLSDRDWTILPINVSDTQSGGGSWAGGLRAHGGDLRYCQKSSLYKPPRAHHCGISK